MQTNHLIVYFSPAGTTRLLAEAIHRRLTEHGCAVAVIDLGDPATQAAERLAASLSRPCCLWIGSPVYCDHPVPAAHAFIEALPSASCGYGVPFVAWGGVTSGLALPELADQLRQKGFLPLAAAKVLAVHSSLWRSPRPLGLGRPNAEDLAQMERLVDVVIEKLAGAVVAPLDLAALNYLSPQMRADAGGKNLALVKAAMPPLTVDQARCTQCGECVEVCPTAAIALTPFPVVGLACVLCLQCVRNCPQEAFPYNSEVVEARIAAMAEHSDEDKVTAIFC